MRISSISKIFLVLFIVSLFLCGCVQQKTFSAQKTEQLASNGMQTFDFDGDGVPDYILYKFTPIGIDGSQYMETRQIGVVVESSASYQGQTTQLNDVQIQSISNRLGQLDSSMQNAQNTCSQMIGLDGIICNDPTTCAKLCASNPECRQASSTYPDVLGGSMLSYIKSTENANTLLQITQQDSLKIKNGTTQDYSNFLNDTRQLVNDISEINANEVYSNEALGTGESTLCQNADFGAPFLAQSAQALGNYTLTNESYHYFVSILLEPENQSPVTPPEITITDNIPVQLNSEQISSFQTINTTSVGENTLISSDLGSQMQYLFVYDFSSNVPPEQMVTQLTSPTLTAKSVNLFFLAPTNAIFNALNSLDGNYYLSLGLAFGITIAILYFIYTAILFILAYSSELKNKPTLISVFRKAFGRAESRWKTDLIVGVLMLIVAFYLASAMGGPQPQATFESSLDVLIQSSWSNMAATALSFLGIITLYLVIDNLVKIRFIEKAYGMALKGEKDAYLSKVDSLKADVHELGELVEQFRNEGYDVGREYDVYSSISLQQIDNMAKETSSKNKILIDEYMAHFETATASLKEKKKSMEGSWPDWKNEITKKLNEQNEVSISSLTMIPQSMRVLAVNRYSKEMGSDSIVLDGQTLKKKKLTPERAISEFLANGLAKGAVLLKGDQVIASAFDDGSATVPTVLALKLRAYAKSLGKSMIQREPGSVVVAGSENTVIYSKHGMLESVLILNRSNAKEALDQWNAKVKMLQN